MLLFSVGFEGIIGACPHPLEQILKLDRHSFANRNLV